jgi:hypothetical protein
MVLIDWPQAEGIEIRDGEPYLTGTDFPIRTVRGHAVPDPAETLAWLAEDYGDTLSRAQLAQAVRYYNENEYVFMVDDEWP